MLDDERSPLHASLKLTGIVKVFPDGMLRPRNAIYEHVFDGAWVHAIQHAQRPQHPDAPPLEIWKTQVYERRPGGYAWNKSERPQFTTPSAMALWPLAQAPHEGMLPMAMALGNVVAVEHLIAEQVQRWRDHAEVTPAGGEAVAAWVQEHLATQADLRSALDTILSAWRQFPVCRQTSMRRTAYGLCKPCDRNWLPWVTCSFRGPPHGFGCYSAETRAGAAGERGIAVSGDVQGVH